MSEEYDYEDSSSQGEPIGDREQTMKDLFNTEERISLLQKEWRGEIKVSKLVNGEKKFEWEKQYNRELAGDRFIRTQMSSLRAICNPTNAISKKTYKECLRILHDSVDAFIKDMMNEPTVERRHYRTLTKSFEHTIEMFMGLPEGGHGANVLNNALAGLNTPVPLRNDKGFSVFNGRK